MSFWNEEYERLLRTTCHVTTVVIVTLSVAGAAPAVAAPVPRHRAPKAPAGAGEFCGPAGVRLTHGHFACTHMS